MALRLLGGVAKGLTLKLPPEKITRPTSAPLKRKLFDSHQNFEGEVFVDLCAGSGSMGLEAWSRGAKEVWFYENHPKVFNLLRNNIQQVHQRFPEESQQRTLLPLKKSFEDFLMKTDLDKNTHVYFDPPYAQEEDYKNFILWAQKFREGCWVWIEYSEQKSRDKTFWQSLSPAKTFVQGDRNILLL